jgi:hypothetical protein
VRKAVGSVEGAKTRGEYSRSRRGLSLLRRRSGAGAGAAGAAGAGAGARVAMRAGGARRGAEARHDHEGFGHQD